MHGLTSLAIIALVGALIRCAILAVFTEENFRHHQATHVFDLMHSFIQSVHVVEYLALLYGISGFYLYARIKRKDYYRLNAIYKRACSYHCDCACVSAIVLCGSGIMALLVLAFTPVALLTIWRDDIITADLTNITKNTGLDFAKAYVGISYVSHICHSVTRIYMVYMTVIIRSAWLYQTYPRLKKVNFGAGGSLVSFAKKILGPKWLEEEVEGNETSSNPKEAFAALIENYNKLGKLIVPLYAIFQHWFVMQWVVYFIKIIDDFSVALHALISEDYKHQGPRNKLVFVLTHLIFDLILFLIPYFCASLINQYHDQYHERLKIVQNRLFSKQQRNWPWMLQNTQLIPQNTKYVFVPSFCGLSIPLNSPGYNLSIILALFAFIISIMTTLPGPKKI